MVLFGLSIQVFTGGQIAGCTPGASAAGKAPGLVGYLIRQYFKGRHSGRGASLTRQLTQGGSFRGHGGMDHDHLADVFERQQANHATS